MPHPWARCVWGTGEAEGGDIRDIMSNDKKKIKNGTKKNLVNYLGLVKVITFFFFKFTSILFYSVLSLFQEKISGIYHETRSICFVWFYRHYENKDGVLSEIWEHIYLKIQVYHP